MRLGLATRLIDGRRRWLQFGLATFILALAPFRRARIGVRTMKSSIIAAAVLILSASTTDVHAACGPLGTFMHWIDTTFISDMDGESIPTSDRVCDGNGSILGVTRYDMDGDSIPTSDRYDMDGDSIPTSDRYDMDGDSIPTSDRYDMDGDSIPTSD
jgi:hypothetical protein